MFFGWYADGQAGEEVYFLALGFKWSELKAYNTQLRATRSKLSWKAAKSLLQKSHDTLFGFIQGKSESTLCPMKSVKNKWTPGRWAEAGSLSHYRSAAKYIRGVIRER